MRWGDHDLYWGRPLKSILACFDNKVLEFKIDSLVESAIFEKAMPGCQILIANFQILHDYVF